MADKSSGNAKKGGKASGLVKRVASLGTDMLVKLGSNPKNVTPNSQPTQGGNKQAVKPSSGQDPLAAFRGRVPGVANQLLGKRFGAVSRVARFVPSSAFDTVTDMVFGRAANLADRLAGSEALLESAGIASLADLRDADPARRDQLADMAIDQNRLVAMLEGGITGGLGFAGKAVDLPALLILVLRTVYQVGYSYGFDLKGESGRALVFEALGQANMDALARKEAVALGINALESILDDGDSQALSLLLAGGNPIVSQVVNHVLKSASRRLKLQRVSFMLTNAARLAGSVNGAVHNTLIIEEVARAAREYFQQARQSGQGSQKLVAHLAAETRSATKPKVTTGAGYGYQTQAAGYGYQTSQQGYGYDVAGRLNQVTEQAAAVGAIMAEGVKEMVNPSTLHHAVDVAADRFDALTTQLGDKLAEVSGTVREYVNPANLASKAHDLIDQAQGKAEGLLDNTEQATQKAADQLRSADSTAVGVKAHDLIDQAAEAQGNVASKAQDGIVSKAQDIAANLKVTVTDKAGGAIGQAKQVAQQMVEQVKVLASQGDTEQGVISKAQELASNLKDTITDKAGDVIDQARQAVQQVTDQAKALASQVGDKQQSGYQADLAQAPADASGQVQGKDAVSLVEALSPQELGGTGKEVDTSHASGTSQLSDSISRNPVLKDSAALKAGVLNEPDPSASQSNGKTGQ